MKSNLIENAFVFLNQVFMHWMNKRSPYGTVGSKNWKLTSFKYINQFHLITYKLRNSLFTLAMKYNGSVRRKMRNDRRITIWLPIPDKWYDSGQYRLRLRMIMVLIFCPLPRWDILILVFHDILNGVFVCVNNPHINKNIVPDN